ncbi:hypothetical protein ACFWC9_15035 [Streptomyces goshikiensis]|uniref:hypothetical protein n=1 Tax=Streptomyces goshikiensis TaxID=1942 RepID=UPI0036C49096
MTPPLPLVVDVHRAGRGDPTEPDDLVEVDAADTKAPCGLVRAEGEVPVEQGGQLVRVDVGGLGVPAEADQQDGPGEVADR